MFGQQPGVFLPPLELAKSREKYRARGEDEVEEAQWYLKDDDQQELSAATKVRVDCCRSVPMRNNPRTLFASDSVFRPLPMPVVGLILFAAYRCAQMPMTHLDPP